MAIYQMAIMGGSALGAALWGELASQISIQVSLLASAGLALLLMGLTRRVTLDAAPAEPLLVAARLTAAAALTAAGSGGSHSV